MKTAGNIFLMLMLAFSLTACPGKNDSNGSAATPDPVEEDSATVSCQWNWSHNNYIDEDGKVCTPTEADLNNTNYCHNYVYNWSTGKWTDSKGKVVKCVQGYVDFTNIQPYNIYYYGSYQANCALYGYGWYPVQFGNALVCVKQTYVNNYFPGYNIYNPNSYYYPTTCRWGVDCHSRCGNISAGGNFGGLWFGGTLGLCQ